MTDHPEYRRGLEDAAKIAEFYGEEIYLAGVDAAMAEAGKGFEHIAMGQTAMNIAAAIRVKAEGTDRIFPTTKEGM